ncbi:PA14 domain-containing protein [Cyclobacterium xiamenense]|uniref:PA14 domain-containing protein n=1 Tax=Cyclobacterium xiamenense TaxID=1297121 RepID=A0A1H6TD99_9BACT|nr:family 16 glycoside hydrolase [Cyclobacterium xiamenense]SEI76154.1 PA14 domain-containing protein [Cyclobacterium xiamenense]
MLIFVYVRKLLLPLLLVVSCRLSAQEVIVFDDLTDFGDIPSTWKEVGEVLADWEQADFLSTLPGSGILVNPPKPDNGPHLVSDFVHGDLTLELEFMVPKGSNSGVYLQGRYEIQIFDSWGKAHPTSGDAGGIYQRWNDEKKQGFEGKAPRTNATRAPGLWQRLKIDFEAPRFDAAGNKVSNAKFNQVFLNGVLVHENVEVTGPTRSAMFEDEQPLGPLMIQGDHGPVAIRNIRYQPFGQPAPEIRDLTYAYYKGKFPSEADFKEGDPEERGDLQKITWDLGHGVLDFAYVYSGTLEIEKAGDYTFSLAAFGKTSLYIDGENIIADGTQFPADSPRSGTRYLPVGPVSFTLVFYKNNYPGRSPQLGVFVEGPGIRKSPLHEANSYVEHLIQKPVYLEPAQEPLLTRGFFEHGGEKKTHTVAVGEPSGISYAYDLEQGALLSLWRGEYLDASPMWRQRGQSQLMLPLGAMVNLAAGPAIAALPAADSPWPDSLGSDQLRIQGYALNRDRRPTFKYLLEGLAVEDFFEPELDGKLLTRTIRYSNPEKRSDLWARIVAAGTLAEVGEGLYSVNQGQFYLHVAKGSPGKVVLRETESGQELLVSLAADANSNSLVYSYIW